MKKIDVVKIVKILGVVMTIGGTVASSWSSDKENTKTLEKLVDERFGNK